MRTGCGPQANWSSGVAKVEGNSGVVRERDRQDNDECRRECSIWLPSDDCGECWALALGTARQQTNRQKARNNGLGERATGNRLKRVVSSRRTRPNQSQARHRHSTWLDSRQATQVQVRFAARSGGKRSTTLHPSSPPRRHCAIVGCVRVGLPNKLPAEAGDDRERSEEVEVTDPQPLSTTRLPFVSFLAFS